VLPATPALHSACSLISPVKRSTHNLCYTG